MRSVEAAGEVCDFSFKWSSIQMMELGSQAKIIVVVAVGDKRVQVLRAGSSISSAPMQSQAREIVVSGEGDAACSISGEPLGFASLRVL
jgi:hypothetical protein